jgi:hypothetical protein
MITQEDAKKVDRFHKLLNADTVVDGKWYRMSHGGYRLVCYINNIVGLYVSQNYKAIPVFIERARRELNDENAPSLNLSYRELVLEYLALMDTLFPRRELH